MDVVRFVMLVGLNGVDMVFSSRGVVMGNGEREWEWGMYYYYLVALLGCL